MRWHYSNNQRASGVFLPAVISIFLFFGLTACDGPFSGTTPDGGTGTMKVLLHDNPGDYQEVWIDVQRVEVNNREDEGSGWVVINEPQQRYNLLELVNGSHEVLGEAELEEGYYRQIRLILGDDNTIVVNDNTYQLQTPSAQQSGLKLKIDAEVQEGAMLTLLLDFDVARSIVQKGRGHGQAQNPYPYLLKPVIRAYTQAEAGSVSGIIDPAEAEPWIYAIADEDTVASTVSEENTGEFQLRGLPENTYTIAIDPASEDYESVSVPDVEVVAGEDTDLGTIEL